ncbi:MAG: type III-B CRISPR module RAMP protein Cmr1 [Thermofilaceae archaeon]
MSPTFEEIAEELSRGGLVARIRVRNVTITRIGGYNARPYSSELDLQERPRSQAIRGVWRWWARALVAGAWYEEYSDFPSSLEDLDELLAPVLGSTNSASKLSLRVSAGTVQAGVEEAERIKRIARLKLFRPPRSEDKRRYLSEENPRRYFSPSKLRFTIELFRRPHASLSSEEKLFSLYSLVLSLALGGVGSITNRGFGSTQLSVSCADKGCRVLQDTLSRMYAAGNPQDVQECLNSLIDNAMSVAKQYLSRIPEKLKPAQGTQLPRYPVLSRKEITVGKTRAPLFRIQVINKPFPDPTSALSRIGSATLKASWKQALKLDPRKESSEKYHTWILGLPRSSEYEGQKTGYVEQTASGYQNLRRQSAILFSVIPSEKGSRRSYYVAVCGFLTFDWLDLLKRESFVHIGGGGEQSVCSLLREIRDPSSGKLRSLEGLSLEQQLVEVFETAWNFVVEILQR